LHALIDGGVINIITEQKHTTFNEGAPLWITLPYHTPSFGHQPWVCADAY